METNSTPTTSARLEAEPSDTLRLPKVRQRTGLGRSTIYRLMALGLFPGSVQLAPRAIGWHKADIDAWLTARPKASRWPAGRSHPASQAGSASFSTIQTDSSSATKRRQRHVVNR